MLDEKLLNIAQHFQFDAPVVDISTLGQGFINDTYIVITEKSRYILQRKNHNIFPDGPAMMDNIQRVTTHLKAKVLAAGGDPMREVLTVVPTIGGELYHCDGENFWAATLYIEGSVPHGGGGKLLFPRGIDGVNPGGHGNGLRQSHFSFRAEGTLRITAHKGELIGLLHLLIVPGIRRNIREGALLPRMALFKGACIGCRQHGNDQDCHQRQ